MNKYRAWDTRNNRMITTFGNDTTVFTSSGFNYVDLTANENGIITANLMEHRNGEIFTKSVETLPLMQSTGLKDKNGVEIFEGDFLEVTSKVYTDFGQRDTGEVSESIKQVTWMEDSWGTKVINSDLTAVGYESKGLLITIKYAVVIGNIHENPELLDEVE